MMNDVAVTATEWTPLGDASNPFTGTFDGQYHTVSGIKVSSGTYGGLFGYTDGATIQNLGVKNVDITADYGMKPWEDALDMEKLLEKKDPVCFVQYEGLKKRFDYELKT